MAWRYAIQVYGSQPARARAAGSPRTSKARLALILLKSYSSAVNGLPLSLKRRAVQALRKASNSEVAGWFRKFGLSASAVALID